MRTKIFCKNYLFKVDILFLVILFILFLLVIYFVWYLNLLICMFEHIFSTLFFEDVLSPYFSGIILTKAHP